ncbi:RBBP9/YdeN family alpha/beta hydrolase [Rhizobium sp. PL01]|jgi:predicted alpha/beta hydrolase family esterase|uniref:RBBP9/YdeN family alpha/beta hydrolase n=1 Tax=Rhizobium sp. PL01 TaxID=3085631 RepID=UPI0029810850|nr:alpha/beta hydrolase [Rhizobium sp. PL01]MDW5318412.1 alpha/beta fold hydrolase [Rhizobium sp. PL01]
MTPTLILPGLNGSNDGHWQRFWLQDNAESRLVEQDDWKSPRVEAWTNRLEEVLVQQGPAYIVAHSLGCLLAAKCADRPSAKLIKGALLVAPCDLSTTENLHPGAIHFGRMPTRVLPFPTITVGSLNDIYMPLESLSLYGRLWKTQVRNIGPAGHINIESGFGRWTGGYELLTLLKMNAKANRNYAQPQAQGVEVLAARAIKTSTSR